MCRWPHGAGEHRRHRGLHDMGRENRVSRRPLATGGTVEKNEAPGDQVVVQRPLNGV